MVHFFNKQFGIIHLSYIKGTLSRDFEWLQLVSKHRSGEFGVAGAYFKLFQHPLCSNSLKKHVLAVSYMIVSSNSANDY
jgi:hypothetical protein